MIANAIHYNSLRKEEPFIKINCAALPNRFWSRNYSGTKKELLPERIKEQKGNSGRRMAAAYFLDEVSEMSAAMQVKLCEFCRKEK